MKTLDDIAEEKEAQDKLQRFVDDLVALCAKHGVSLDHAAHHGIDINDGNTSYRGTERIERINGSGIHTIPMPDRSYCDEC